MEVEYRIANRSGEYYPQVRYKKFLFWSKWKKIAKYPTGYGMYSLPDWNYPKTKTECEEIIKDFHDWFQKENTSVVEYSKFYYC